MLPKTIPQLANPFSEDGSKRHASAYAKVINILYILYSLEVGIALLWLPWLDIWENNSLLYLYPQLHSIVSSPFLKGAVLGLGIDNILIGISEVVHFKTVS
jgi:hypothetical protein